MQIGLYFLGFIWNFRLQEKLYRDFIPYTVRHSLYFTSFLILYVITYTVRNYLYCT